jgi:hypothetical protein
MFRKKGTSKMKALSLAAVLAVIGLSVVPTFANEDGDNDSIHGRSAFAVESALRERGVVASSVEEWGGLIRAWVPDGNGGTTMLFFDADTLQRVSPTLS